MARFGVHSLFAPRPLPISPRAGVESKKVAKCDIIRRQDAKKGVTKAKKNELQSKILLPEREVRQLGQMTFLSEREIFQNL